MFTEFATWGDMKALIQRINRDERHKKLQAFDVDFFASKAKAKTDDEFFFSLTESEIIKARMTHWPYEEHPGDTLTYEVCPDSNGTITLFLIVNNERCYFRWNGQWIYVGPGDTANQLLQGPRYGADETIVEVYDDRSSRGEETTYTFFAEHIPRVHEIYLSNGQLGYYSYLHSSQAAYLLVTMFAFNDSNNAEPTLFLIAHDHWLCRRAGAWHEVNWDQIVGPGGEFRGLLISQMLEATAVSAWDSVNSPVDLSDAAVYCAAFPIFRFEAYEYGQARFVCDTENATWEANGEGWTLLRKGRPRSMAKRLSIESFTLGSWQREGPVGQPGLTASTAERDAKRLDGAIELGLLTLVNPILADEARKWFFGLPESDGRSALSYGLVNKFLLSSASPLVYIAGDHCTALKISNGEVLWQRTNGKWSICEVAEPEDAPMEQKFMTVDIFRLPELTAWWDSRAEDSRLVQELPGNYNFIGSYECLGGFEVDCLYVEDSIRVIDGTRCWYRSNGQWEVEGWVNDPEEDDDEPYAEERLPDWFYNA